MMTSYGMTIERTCCIQTGISWNLAIAMTTKTVCCFSLQTAGGGMTGSVPPKLNLSAKKVFQRKNSIPFTFISLFYCINLQ